VGVHCLTTAPDRRGRGRVGSPRPCSPWRTGTWP